MKAIIKNIIYRVWLVLNNNNDAEYLFILGHPRSGSSVLMHILTTNPEIAGAGEYFTIYNTERDLFKAEFDIRRKSNKLFKPCQYIVNQVLHDSRTPDHQLLASRSNKFIFLIRNPEDAISSMVVITGKFDPSVTRKEIISQYISRLNELKELAYILNRDQWTFVDYDELVDQTESTLQKLTHFLSIKQPLNSEYSIQRFSRNSGDPSENILKGHVFRTGSEKVHFEKNELIDAMTVYRDVLGFFRNQ